MEMSMNSLSSWMLPCPVKALTGMECPGCGFQRSLWALLQGDIAGSWHAYPALIPFLVTVAMIPVAVKSRLPYRMQLLGGTLALTCLLIATNYFSKMS